MPVSLTLALAAAIALAAEPPRLEASAAEDDADCMVVFTSLLGSLMQQEEPSPTELLSFSSGLFYFRGKLMAEAPGVALEEWFTRARTERLTGNTGVVQRCGAELESVGKEMQQAEAALKAREAEEAAERTTL